METFSLHLGDTREILNKLRISAFSASDSQLDAHRDNLLRNFDLLSGIILDPNNPMYGGNQLQFLAGAITKFATLIYQNEDNTIEKDSAQEWIDVFNMFIDQLAKDLFILDSDNDNFLRHVKYGPADSIDFVEVFKTFFVCSQIIHDSLVELRDIFSEFEVYETENNQIEKIEMSPRELEDIKDSIVSIHKNLQVVLNVYQKLVSSSALAKDVGVASQSSPLITADTKEDVMLNLTKGLLGSLNRISKILATGSLDLPEYNVDRVIITETFKLIAEQFSQHGFTHPLITGYEMLGISWQLDYFWSDFNNKLALSGRQSKLKKITETVAGIIKILEKKSTLSGMNFVKSIGVSSAVTQGEREEIVAEMKERKRLELLSGYKNKFLKAYEELISDTVTRRDLLQLREECRVVLKKLSNYFGLLGLRAEMHLVTEIETKVAILYLASDEMKKNTAKGKKGQKKKLALDQPALKKFHQLMDKVEASSGNGDNPVNGGISLDRMLEGVEIKKSSSNITLTEAEIKNLAGLSFTFIGKDKQMTLKEIFA